MGKINFHVLNGMGVTLDYASADLVKKMEELCILQGVDKDRATFTIHGYSNYCYFAQAPSSQVVQPGQQAMMTVFVYSAMVSITSLEPETDGLPGL